MNHFLKQLANLLRKVTNKNLAKMIYSIEQLNGLYQAVKHGGHVLTRNEISDLIIDLDSAIKNQHLGLDEGAKNSEFIGMIFLCLARGSDYLEANPNWFHKLDLESIYDTDAVWILLAMYISGNIPNNINVILKFSQPNNLLMNRYEVCLASVRYVGDYVFNSKDDSIYKELLNNWKNIKVIIKTNVENSCDEVDLRRYRKYANNCYRAIQKATLGKETEENSDINDLLDNYIPPASVVPLPPVSPKNPSQ